MHYASFSSGTPIKTFETVAVFIDSLSANGSQMKWQQYSSKNGRFTTIYSRQCAAHTGEGTCCMTSHDFKQSLVTIHGNKIHVVTVLNNIWRCFESSSICKSSACLAFLFQFARYASHHQEIFFLPWCWDWQQKQQNETEMYWHSALSILSMPLTRFTQHLGSSGSWLYGKCDHRTASSASSRRTMNPGLQQGFDSIWLGMFAHFDLQSFYMEPKTAVRGANRTVFSTFKITIPCACQRKLCFF